MPKLLDKLRHGFQALGFTKPDTVIDTAGANQSNSKEDIPESYMPWEPISMRLPGRFIEALVGEQYLQHIVTQASSEGFHVESLTIFRYGNLKPSESISAIEEWAAASGLKVSINHEHDICFFEKA